MLLLSLRSSHHDDFAVALLSLCCRFAVALLSLCCRFYRFAVALLSLCCRFAPAALHSSLTSTSAAPLILVIPLSKFTPLPLSSSVALQASKSSVNSTASPSSKAVA